MSALTALTASCSSVDPQVYSKEQPALDLQHYFRGDLTGHGMFLNRSGQVERRFVVHIQATWSEDARGTMGTLKEDFDWSDGKKEKRVWTLRPVPAQPGHWTGTAADVLGEAQGIVSGNALIWSYTLALATDSGSTYNIKFDDQMFLIDQGVMLNRAVMSYWGFNVGQILISFTH